MMNARGPRSSWSVGPRCIRDKDGSKRIKMSKDYDYGRSIPCFSSLYPYRRHCCDNNI